MMAPARLFPLAVLLSPLAVSAEPPNADGQWRGSFSAGVSAARGNTETTNFNIGGEGTRLTPRDKLAYSFTALYGLQTTSSGGTTETANLARGSAQYDNNISPRTFSYVSLGLDRDRLQRLELRTLLGVGLGRHIVATPQTAFDVFSGVTYNRENFFDLSRSSAELVLGEEVSHKVSDNTSFKERFAVFPNLKESGEYRAQFDASLSTAINNRLGLQLTLSDRFQSNPVAGVKNNDLLFLTSITYKFGPK